MGRRVNNDEFVDEGWASNPMHHGQRQEGLWKSEGSSLPRPLNQYQSGERESSASKYLTPHTKEWVACHTPPEILVGERVLVKFGSNGSHAGTVRAFQKVLLTDAMKGKNSMVSVSSIVRWQCVTWRSSIPATKLVSPFFLT